MKTTLIIDDALVRDAKAFAAAEPQLAQELLKRDYDAWLESRKKLLRIEILRAEFRGGR